MDSQTSSSYNLEVLEPFQAPETARAADIEYFQRIAWSTWDWWKSQMDQLVDIDFNPKQLAIKHTSCYLLL